MTTHFERGGSWDPEELYVPELNLLDAAEAGKWASPQEMVMVLSRLAHLRGEFRKAVRLNERLLDRERQGDENHG